MDFDELVTVDERILWDRSKSIVGQVDESNRFQSPECVRGQSPHSSREGPRHFQGQDGLPYFVESVALDIFNAVITQIQDFEATCVAESMV